MNFKKHLLATGVALGCLLTPAFAQTPNPEPSVKTRRVQEMEQREKERAQQDKERALRSQEREQQEKERALRAQEKAQRDLERAMTKLHTMGGGSFLGVGVVEIDSERAKALKLKEERGVEIRSIEPDSPAAKAALKESDVVLEYNGERVEGTEEFMRLVRETPVGRQVRLAIWRNGAPQTATVTIAERQPFNLKISTFPKMPEIWIPDMPRMSTYWRTPVLGIESEALGSQLGEYFGVKEGVLVRSVLKDSAAEKAGIKAGDVITKVDESSVKEPRQISNVLRGLQSGKSVAVTLVREHKEMTLSVTLDTEGSLRPRGIASLEGATL
jgi:serine protease Do